MKITAAWSSVTVLAVIGRLLTTFSEGSLVPPWKIIVVIVKPIPTIIIAKTWKRSRRKTRNEIICLRLRSGVQQKWCALYRKVHRAFWWNFLISIVLSQNCPSHKVRKGTTRELKSLPSNKWKKYELSCKTSNPVKHIFLIIVLTFWELVVYLLTKSIISS